MSSIIMQVVRLPARKHELDCADQEHICALKGLDHEEGSDDLSEMWNIPGMMSA